MIIKLTTWTRKSFSLWTPLTRACVSTSSRRAERIRKDSLRALRRAQVPGSGHSRRTIRAQRRWVIVLKVLTWVGRGIFPQKSPVVPSDSIFGPFLTKLEWVVASQGYPGAITWIKVCRQSFYRWLCSLGNGTETLFETKRVSEVFGLPFVKEILKWVRLYRRDPSVGLDPEAINVLRMANTGLTSLRSFRLPPVLDVDPIVDPGIAPVVPRKDIIQRFWISLGITMRIKKNLKKVEWRKWHFTVRAGPNGPALLSSLRDLSVLTESLKESILEIGGPLFRTVFGHLERITPLFSDLYAGRPPMETVTNPTKSGADVSGEPDPSGSRGGSRSGSGNRRRVRPRYTEKKEGLLRKLVMIPDLEGKTRNVAILDYFSQTVLRPIHFFLFEILRKMNSDVTFDQDSFVKKVQEWGPDVDFTSVDLTKATDRFPISIIGTVLSVVFGSRFVSHWENIMVGLPFRAPDGSEVKYCRGNPMGALSSWASFAITHHFVVFWACEESGVPWKTAKYVLLGDDILFGDKALADAYMLLLTKLGVDYSIEKTFKSKGFFEFAKRIYFLGAEVTGFPVSSLVDNVKSVALIVSALHGEERKGIRPVLGIPGAVQDLDAYLFPGSNASWRQKRRSYAFQADLMYRALRPGVDPEGISGFTRTLLSQYPWAKEHPALWEDPVRVRFLWSRACEASLRSSAESGMKNPNSLGPDLVRQTLSRVTKLRKEWAVWTSVLEEMSPSPPGSDGLPLPLVTVRYAIRPDLSELHMWVLPVMGALSRLSATTHLAVHTALEGYGVQKADWPALVRSIGYGLPEFLDSRAPDKVLREAVAHRLALGIIEEAKREVGVSPSLPDRKSEDLILDLQSLDPSSHDWAMRFLKPQFGIIESEKAKELRSAILRYFRGPETGEIGDDQSEIPRGLHRLATCVPTSGGT